jgi:hypothetical protein
MKRVTCALAAATLTAGLLSLSPPASAVDTCAETLGGQVFNGADVVLGPRETGQVSFEMYEATRCLALHPPSPSIVTAARRVIPLVITSTTDNDAGFVTLRGTLTIDASGLKNADAGEWLFQFDAGDLEGGVWPLNVLRQTTLSFDAGPEPLRRNHRLTFHGTLRAADWERGSYRGVRGQEVRINPQDGQPPGTIEPVAVTQTKRHGRYRVSAEVAGPNRFMAVSGSIYPSPLAFARSRIDTVAGRP